MDERRLRPFRLDYAGVASIPLKPGTRRPARGAFPLVLAAAGLVACSRAPHPRLPDVVLIIADDHDYESLGFMGDERVHTPALDELAAAGAVFMTGHAPVSRCRPSLASLLSGRWPQQHGIYYNVGPASLNPRNSLARLLADAGYATYQAGKFWEGEPRDFGFLRSVPEGKLGFARQGQEDLFRFVDESPPDRPLFIWWAPQLPHTPFDPPERFRALFDRAALPVPDWFEARPSATAPPSTCSSPWAPGSTTVWRSSSPACDAPVATRTPSTCS